MTRPSKSTRMRVAREYINSGISEAETFANRRPFVSVGQGSYQVWIRADREMCFRAYRAAMK